VDGEVGADADPSLGGAAVISADDAFAVAEEARLGASADSTPL